MTLQFVPTSPAVFFTLLRPLQQQWNNQQPSATDYFFLPSFPISSTNVNSLDHSPYEMEVFPDIIAADDEDVSDVLNS